MEVKKILNKPSEMAIFIDKQGYTKAQLKIILLTTIIFGFDGFHLTLASNMLIPFQSYYEMNIFWLEISSAIIFLGLAIGSLFLTNLIDLCGSRMNLFKKSLYVLFIGHFLLFATPNKYCFTIARFICGLAIGILTAITLSITCETIPFSSRGLMISVCWCGYSFFQGLTSIFMIWIMPEYEPNRTPYVLISMFIVMGSLGIYCHNNIFYSPENLVLKKQYEEAYNVISDLISPNLISKEKFEILKQDLINKTNEMSNENNEYFNEAQSVITNSNNEHRELLIDKNDNNTKILSFNEKAYKSDIYNFNEDKNMFSHINELFKEQYIKSTYLICIICICSACIFYGPLLIQTVTLLKLVEAGKISLIPREIMMSSLNVSLSLLISNPIGGYIGEIKGIGRKYAMLICYFICFLANLTLLINDTYYETCQVVILFSGNVAYNNFITYFTEIFPTSIRDTSVSFFCFIMRMGGFISQFLFLQLFTFGYEVPYFILLFLLFVVVLSIYNLPYDTAPQESN